MKLSVTIDGVGGHTEVLFEDGRVKLIWKETSLRERKMLKELLEKARTGGMKTYEVDKHGNAGEETDKNPGTIFNRSGELILKGEGSIVKLIASGLIDAEQKSGRLVMEAQKDNTWKILGSGEKIDLENEPEKEKKVHTTAKVGGG